MNGWSQGYITAIPYTSRFHRELAPVSMRMALRAAGVSHDIDPDNFRLCDLGCGRGLDCNILAATHPRASFVGVDFNPAHIADAKALAAAAGLGNVEFFESDLAGFAARDLAPFDIVVLHGVWSWVSVENRDVVVGFLRRHLRPGGLAYVSYNALPGWSALLPLGRYIYEQVAADSGDMDGRIERALRSASELRNANAGCFRDNPQAGTLLDDLIRRSDAYIAHEFCNRDWTPFHHADVARHMAEADLHFVASADPRDLVSGLDLTKDQTAQLASAPGVTQRESLRDRFVSPRLRRDIFLKGRPRMAGLGEKLAGMRLALIPISDRPAILHGAAISFALDDDASSAISQVLSRGPRTLEDLRKNHAMLAMHSEEALIESVRRLMGGGLVEPCLDATEEGQRAQVTSRLNGAILDRAHMSGEIGHLASPVTGNGVAVSRHDQLFLLARRHGHADPVKFAVKTLARQGVQVARDGLALRDDGEILGELRRRYEQFEAERLPLLDHLRLVPVASNSVVP